jgi:hypothetical protein
LLVAVVDVVLVDAAVDADAVDAVVVATAAVAGGVAGWLSGLTFIWIFPGLGKLR